MVIGSQRISKNGIDMVKHFEGLKLRSYRCSAGVLTIGYGSTRDVLDGMIITKEEADNRLNIDISKSENSVNRLITVPLKQCQFDALVSFTYNLGGGVLQRSTLRQKLNRKEYNGAANEFLKWVYAGGVKRRGLAYRRKAERALFLSI